MGVTAPRSVTAQEQGKEPEKLPQHFPVLGTHNIDTVPHQAPPEEPHGINIEPAFGNANGINHQGFLPHALQKAEMQIWISDFSCSLIFNCLFFLKGSKAANPCILLTLVQFVFKSLFYFLFQCHMLLCQHNTGSS